MHDTLWAEIVTGVIPPGTRLMETDLAARFATSRGPVRSALKELERNGLVVSNPRRGTSVLPMSANDVDEIFSLYGALAPLAFRLACERMTPDDLAHLRELLEPVGQAHDDIPAWSEATMRFQRGVFEISRHSRLLAVWEMIESQGRVLATLLAVTDSGEVPDVADFHSLVFDALAARDARAAERIVSRHVEQMRQNFTRGKVRTRLPPGDGRRRT